MVNVSLKRNLEEIAAEMRKVLEFDNRTLITVELYQELVEKIQKHFTNFKIEYVLTDTYLTLKDKEIFTLHLNNSDRDNGTRKKFEELVRFFTFYILFNKESLDSLQLEYHKFSDATVYSNKEVSYLRLAFIFPQEAFLRETIKYSIGDGVDILAMEKALNSLDVLERGIDIGIWP